jgi:hypothetical protein
MAGPAHKGRGYGTGKGYPAGCTVCRHPNAKEITELMIGPIGDPDSKRASHAEIKQRYSTKEHPFSPVSLSRHWHKCIKPVLAGAADEQVTTRAELMVIESFQGYLKRHETILARLIDSAESELLDPNAPGRYVMLGDGKRKYFEFLLRLLDRSQKHIELIGKLEGRFKEPEDTGKAPDVQLVYIRQLILQHKGGKAEQDAIDIESVTPGSPLEQ